MKIGLDIGGTFTDAVALEGDRIEAQVKRRTTRPSLLPGVLSAIDGLLDIMGKEKISSVDRVTLSTTVVTNTLVMGKEDRVPLFIIPGPGRSIEGCFPVDPVVIEGYTDHQGRLQAEVDVNTLEKALEDLHSGRQFDGKAGESTDSPCVKAAAVSAKFSIRNQACESKVAEILKEKGYDFVSQGARLSGRLNFMRRTVSAYYNSAVARVFSEFKATIEEALRTRQIDAPIYILKADGGSLPLDYVVEKPVETVFTGPAASVLGVQSLVDMPKETTVVLDMGGTTTDISLWEGGEPLLARGGVAIGDYPSAVQSFAVNSVGVAGDTVINCDGEGTWTVGPERLGPSMALGGPVPTLGDALRVLGASDYGSMERAHYAVALALGMVGKGEVPCYEEGKGDEGQLQDAHDYSSYFTNSEMELIRRGAEGAVDQAVLQIQRAIEGVCEAQSKLPVYEVQDIVSHRDIKAEHIVAVGGTATALAPYVAKHMGLRLSIPRFAAVANAVGAAVARQTLSLSATVDTKKRRLLIPELGISQSTTIESLGELKSYVEKYLIQCFQERGMEGTYEFEVLTEEAFPVLEGWAQQSMRLAVEMQGRVGGVIHVK